jgi:hypothetical protein
MRLKWIITFLLAFNINVHSQIISFVAYKHQADITVSYVKYKHQADVIIYWAKYKHQAEPGIWYEVKDLSKYNNDVIKVYVTYEKSKADFKVYFAKYKHEVIISEEYLKKINK